MILNPTENDRQLAGVDPHAGSEAGAPLNWRLEAVPLMNLKTIECWLQLGKNHDAQSQTTPLQTTGSLPHTARV